MCQEELHMFTYARELENDEFEPTSITAGENSLIYNTQPEGEGKNIYDIITNLEDSSFAGKMEIIRGELLLNSTDETEIRVAQSLGIRVNPYLIVDGVLLSANTNLALMDENGSLTIPENVKAIGEGAFADLSGLKTIIIPGTVEEIRQNAFRNNADLENVILQEGVKKIGAQAFQSCVNIKSVELPESLENIETQAFYLCTSLSKIEIPANVEYLSAYAFSGCSNMVEIILNEGLKSIDGYAVSSTSINTIVLPKSVEYIGGNAFNNCKNLETIKIAEENEIFEFDETSGMLIQNDEANKAKSIIFIIDKKLRESTIFEIPEGVTKLEVSLASYNIQTIKIPSSLNSLNVEDLPNSVSEIILDAYNETYIIKANCLYTKDGKTLVMCYSKDEAIVKTDFLEEVEIIGEYAFKPAINLKNIELPDSVLRIGKMAFQDNKMIEKIKMGEKVEYISPLFKYQNYIGQVEIESSNPNYTIKNNELYSKNEKELITVLYEIDGRYVLPDNVTKIGDYAFYFQDKMTDVELNNELIEISNYAFGYCNGLTTIYIPNNVEKMASTVFDTVDNLNKIQIDKEPGSITGSPWGATKGDRIVEWLK